jgi:hypothetical protein
LRVRRAFAALVRLGAALRAVAVDVGVGQLAGLALEVDDALRQVIAAVGKVWWAGFKGILVRDGKEIGGGDVMPIDSSLTRGAFGESVETAGERVGASAFAHDAVVQGLDIGGHGSSNSGGYQCHEGSENERRRHSKDSIELI